MPLTTAERFKRRMQLIAPRPMPGVYGNRWIIVPENSDALANVSFERGQRRRRGILYFLLTAITVSLLLAPFVGVPAWRVAAAFGTSMVLYVVLLLDAKRRRSLARNRVIRARGRVEAVLAQRGS